MYLFHKFNVFLEGPIFFVNLLKIAGEIVVIEFGLVERREQNGSDTQVLKVI
jgi:hypothetical protein